MDPTGNDQLQDQQNTDGEYEGNLFSGIDSAETHILTESLLETPTASPRAEVYYKPAARAADLLMNSPAPAVGDLNDCLNTNNPSQQGGSNSRETDEVSFVCSPAMDKLIEAMKKAILDPTLDSSLSDINKEGQLSQAKPSGDHVPSTQIIKVARQVFKTPAGKVFIANKTSAFLTGSQAMEHEGVVLELHAPAEALEEL